MSASGPRLSARACSINCTNRRRPGPAAAPWTTPYTPTDRARSQDWQAALHAACQRRAAGARSCATASPSSDPLLAGPAPPPGYRCARCRYRLQRKAPRTGDCARSPYCCRQRLCGGRLSSESARGNRLSPRKTPRPTPSTPRSIESRSSALRAGTPKGAGRCRAACPCPDMGCPTCLARHPWHARHGPNQLPLTL